MAQEMNGISPIPLQRKSSASCVSRLDNRRFCASHSVMSFLRVADYHRPLGRPTKERLYGEAYASSEYVYVPSDFEGYDEGDDFSALMETLPATDPARQRGLVIRALAPGPRA